VKLEIALANIYGFGKLQCIVGIHIAATAQ
jgi:hypothetical protein